MDLHGRAWISRLPDELSKQRRLLEGLVELSESDPDVRWLVIGCSLSRGAGDRLSDLDVAVGVRWDEGTEAGSGPGIADVDSAGGGSDSASGSGSGAEEKRRTSHGAAAFPVFDGIADRIGLAVDRIGGLVDSYHHQLPGVAQPHRRIFAQYADRGQIDLVVFPAAIDAGAVPGTVVLYDPDGLVRLRAVERQRGTPQLVREWAFQGWCALADFGKYLRRGSLWEAQERLHEARSQLWKVHAAAHSVPDPQFGITSIVDFAPEQLPDGVVDTVCPLEPARMLLAARTVARLLRSAAEKLPDELGATYPHAMADYITRDLNELRLETADRRS